MGAGGGLGVVLDGVGGDVQAADPLDHVVVEPDVGDHDPAVTSVAVGSGGLALQRHVEGEAMVLGGDLDLPGLAVQHGLVDAAVAVLELVGGEAQCPAQQLVAQADAEEGQAGIQCPAQQLDLGIGGSRVPGAVGEEDGVGGDGQQVKLNSSHVAISYAVFCLKKKINLHIQCIVHKNVR